MPVFDQSTISNVQAARWGGDLVVSWVSTLPQGSWFQVYLSRSLAWYGTARRVTLPGLSPGSWIDVGAVAAADRASDLSAYLPAPAGTGNRVQLTWLGGTYLAPDLAGFRVYRSAVAGGSVDYTTILATVPAYPGGIVTDGYGLGGYGQGGYGQSATSYRWVSGPLTSGVWSFAVVPYDNAGNESAHTLTISATITTAPQEPAAFSDGTRLHYSFNATTPPTVTLSWNASPG